MHKNAIFIEKLQKNRLELGVSLPDPPCLRRLGAPHQDLQSSSILNAIHVYSDE